MTVTRSRSTSRGAAISWAQPELTSCWASTERAKPPTRSRGLLLLGAQQQHLAGVGVGRARLGVEVVAVVPDRDQAEVVDRREGGRAGAEHDPAAAARDSEEVAVAGGGAGVGASA